MTSKPVFPVTAQDLISVGVNSSDVDAVLVEMEQFWNRRNCEPKKNFFLETWDMFTDS